MLDLDKLKKYLDELINYAENGNSEGVDKIKTKILEEYSDNSKTGISLSWNTKEAKKESISGPFEVRFTKMGPDDFSYKREYWREFENIEDFKNWAHGFNTPVEDWDIPERKLWEDEKSRLLPSFTIAQPVYDQFMIDIEMIETNEGIIFSSGRFTSGNKYVGEKGWKVIEELVKKPDYKFV